MTEEIHLWSWSKTNEPTIQPIGLIKPYSIGWTFQPKWTRRQSQQNNSNEWTNNRFDEPFGGIYMIFVHCQDSRSIEFTAWQQSTTCKTWFLQYLPDILSPIEFHSNLLVGCSQCYPVCHPNCLEFKSIALLNFVFHFPIQMLSNLVSN